MPCLDISSFFPGSNNLHLISYLFWWSKCRYHYINLLDCLHQAFMMIYVSPWNNHMTFKINILIQSIKNTPTMWRTRVCTYVEKCHSRALETLNEFRLSGLEAVFSLTNAKVGRPTFALSSTMYFPMYPVPPIIKILLFRAIGREFRMKWTNGLKQNREFGLS